MKTKLLLSILFFCAFLQSNAQNVLPAMKPRPADYEYLSAPDSLETKHSFGLQNIVDKTTLTSQTKLPYPVIFIHGLNSSKSTWAWDTTASQLMSPFGLTYGGRFDVNLNYDDTFSTSNLTTDTYLYNSTPTTFQGGDFYYVNFAVDSGGIIHTNTDGTINASCSNLSNQSAIAKQGYALKGIINKVKQLTGRDKVVLMGHSMGGLAAREYLQNTNNWQDDGLPHVAKLATTGTPHGGSNAIGGQIVGVDYNSEAIRDLKKQSVYLEGGYESSVSTSYYNSDVNCNGVSNDGLNILGLNQRNYFSDVDYSCVIGTGLSILGVGGDGAVTVDSANWNNANIGYSNLTQNIFSVNKIHTQLPGDWYSIMQAIDEPNNFPVAYEVGISNNANYGFISEQSTQCSYYPTDYDDYKFTLTNNSNVSISVNTPNPFYIYARIVSNDQTTQIGTVHSSNGTSNITFTQNNLPAGNYFLEIYANPASNTITEYNFNLNSTLSTDNFESNNSLNLFPNPTNSKVFFDNTNSNFKEVSIYNYLGQEVAKTNFTATSSTQEIDMSTLATGVYVLKFSDGSTSKSVKVVKQ